MNPQIFQGAARFHEAGDLAVIAQPQFREFWPIDKHLYTFETFFHPFIGALIKQLNEATGDPIAALCDPKFLAGRHEDCFAPGYQVSTDVVVNPCSEKIDLDHQLPYANYNWELLYHIPVAVAVHLSQHQRFAEAQKWFHYVFDPTSKDLDVPAPARFWKFLYFRTQPPTLDLGTLLRLLSDGSTVTDPAQVAQMQDILTSYAASCLKPFQPFAVARPRMVAFQYYVVMKYLDNLIAWGDSLFSQMTIETVNEATLSYALAANLLGQRPQKIPPIGTTTARSYNDLKKVGLDKMGDALVELEGQFPFNITTSAPAGDGSETGPVFGMGRSLYFCIPPNSKLLGYWDTVEDRLAKIRNCENIRGQVQLMPLFDPPIDPGMLIKATAAGLDIGSVVAGLNQPVSPIRTPLLIQQALELCAEVRSLGAGLLSAIEKGDAEHLAQLRQTHEVALQQMMQNVRFLQWQQAKAATESLLRSRASALERYTFYLRLLGLKPDATNVPQTFTIDRSQDLTEDNFDDAYDDLVAKYDLPIPMQAYPSLQLADGSSPSAQSGASGAGRLYLNANENAELTHMVNARNARAASFPFDIAASVFAPLPDFEVDLHYWGIGVHSKISGGGKMSEVSKILAEALRAVAAWQQDQAAMTARKAGYQRRTDDWLLQANLAARELSQLGRQLLASLLTEQAAQREYATAKAQVGQSQEVLGFLQTKFTSEELYGWMQGQLSNLYYQYYRFALDTARKAEQTMKWELMRPDLDAATYIQTNYWDSGHLGLLAGEALHLDLKRMELDYHNYNLRELELTRHVSLRQLDPVALLSLKITGACTVTIPEWLYDRDCPGHYMRRIKTVGVSVPSVVGPYTSVNCTVTLQHSSVRVSPQKGSKYQRDPSNTDPRFIDYSGSIQSIVTSGAVADSGMFETNLRDERFLPFEGAGAISTWALSLPAIPSFDYETISDVILHVRYTARDGGQALGSQALAALKELPPTSGAAADPAPSLALLLSLRHDFPTQWYAFTSGTADFTASLTMDYFPYFVQDTTVTVNAMTLYADSGHQALTVPADMSSELKNDKATTLTFAEDQNILTRDPSKEVYVVIAYNARRA